MRISLFCAAILWASSAAAAESPTTSESGLRIGKGAESATICVVSDSALTRLTAQRLADFISIRTGLQPKVAPGPPAGSESGIVFLLGRESEPSIRGVTSQPSAMLPDMKAYREDVHKHMVAQGRKPSDCKVLFLINPIIGETVEEAKDRKKKREAIAFEKIDERLAHFGKVTNIDFGTFDLDKPLPDHVTTNGHQANLEQFRKMANGRSIRETMASFNAVDLSVELVGTPDHIAARMGEVMDEVGGDGFLFSMPNVNRRTLAEIEDGLVPALQDRGLMRKAYEHKHFRDNLLAY